MITLVAGMVCAIVFLGVVGLCDISGLLMKKARVFQVTPVE